MTVEKIQEELDELARELARHVLDECMLPVGCRYCSEIEKSIEVITRRVWK